MTESDNNATWKETFKKRLEQLRSIGRTVMAVIVASRIGFGFNLPFTNDGKSLKEIGLEDLGYHLDKNGELEKDSNPKK
jgi:hypothetical protein